MEERHERYYLVIFISKNSDTLAILRHSLLNSPFIILDFISGQQDLVDKAHS